DPARTGGYRLHLDHRACAALRRRLDPELYQAVLASSAPPRAFSRFAVTDHRMRLLFTEPRDPSRETLLIGRIPLRRLLAHGLHDALHLGSEFTGHRVNPDGIVTAHFADGGTDRADLLVGADGVGSRVAAALAGRPTSAPSGISGLAGRTALTPAIRPLVPDLLEHGPALAFGPAGIGLFLTLHDPGAEPAVDHAACTAVAPITEPPALIWGLLAPDPAYPGRPRHLDGPELVRTADALLDGWASPVRALIRDADPATAAFFGFHATDPGAPLTPWPAGHAIALGDAGPATPPTPCAPRCARWAGCAGWPPRPGPAPPARPCPPSPPPPGWAAPSRGPAVPEPDPAPHTPGTGVWPQGEPELPMWELVQT